MSTIPLYQYQIEATDCLQEAVVDNDLEVKVDGPNLISKCRSFYLTSPLGSGKTRMISRTVKMMLDNTSFQEKVYSFDIGPQSSVLKTSIDSKIFIIVPVSIVTQWETELNLWDVKFYSVVTPKSIKPISEIDEKIILITDYRTKDLKKTFFDKNLQYYVFIDEYDTCHITRTFTEICFPLVKSKICISAKFDGTDYYPIKKDKIDICRIIISDKIVKESITLPDINETILKFSLCSILTDNYDNFDNTMKNDIKNGNLRQVFNNYGLSPNSTIDKLFSEIIEKKKNAIADHWLHTGLTTDPYAKKLKDQCSKLEKSLENHWKVCAGCRNSIATIKNASNCLSCYDFYCQTCAVKFKNDSCVVCIAISKNSSIDTIGDGMSYSFKTRFQCLEKILQSIKQRKDGFSKKVLVYCSYIDLVDRLNQHLESNNFWSFPLEGSSSARLEKISRFKAADTDIYLVCNSIQNSAGIHLPETTDIIIFHELEDKYDLQVVGRAQRIGRKTSLFVHRIQDSLTN